MNKLRDPNMIKSKMKNEAIILALANFDLKQKGSSAVAEKIADLTSGSLEYYTKMVAAINDAENEFERNWRIQRETVWR